LFDPGRYGVTALGFRYFGPLLRFDHHQGRGKDRQPEPDPERGVYYAALSLSSCLVEIFGDTGVIDFDRHHVASPRPGRNLHLLDLRGPGAMKAGVNAAIAKVPDRMLSQAWSRYFHEHSDIYAEVDGLIYLNAHNDEEALVLYERAADALECPPERVIRLDNEALRPALLEAANNNDLIPGDSQVPPNHA
jgi:hypothetical protein